MSIATAIVRFRSRQADQFTTTATITRPSGAPTTNPTTGVVTQASTTIGTAVPCKQVSIEQLGSDLDAAETSLGVVDVGFRFPVGTDIERDDLIEVTGSTYNPTDIGRTYRALSIDRREWQIARRVAAQEVLAP